MSRHRPAAAGAALLAAALAASVAPAVAQSEDPDREQCYGVSLAGENDGLDEDDAPGGAQVNYQGNAWAWVLAGQCLTLPLPPQPDGTPRRGSYEPLERDAP